METQLRLSVGGFPPFSARGCVQELFLISDGRFSRTVNGELLYLGGSYEGGGHKYKTVITCQDKAPLASEGLVRGLEVDVECLQRLTQKVSGKSVVLERDPVGGSLEIIKKDLSCVGIYVQKDRNIVFVENIEGFVTYRPRLKMRVVSFSLSSQEWDMKSQWRLEMEEI